MTPDGARQYPTGVSLILSDARGETQRLELRAPRQANNAAKRPFLLPLPAGAAFSFAVDLRNYWTIASKPFDPSLKPGTYSLLAQFNSFAETTIREPLSAQSYVFVGMLDNIVYPQPNGVPTSNNVQFHVAQ